MNAEGDAGTGPRAEAAADAVHRARAYLLGAAEPPAPALAAFVAGHGPMEAAERVRRGDVPERVAQETEARRDTDRSERDLARAAEAGYRLLTPEDDEWPAWPLLSLEVATGRGADGVAPPLGLWVRGTARLDESVDGAVAVVGARAATEYGEYTAAELAHGLVAEGVAVFSGAAYGIDGAAHRGALAAGGPTVAVLGCGLDAGYPAGHVGLLNRIADRGAVISEYPPGAPPARHRFLVRNRLLAALTAGTVVVEAGRRSGARNTSSTAGVLGKVVMAVPGPVGSATSVGCHELIREAYATLVGSVSDVLSTVGRLGDHGGEATAPRPRRPTDELGPQALRVHEALGRRRGLSPEAVAEESGVPLARVRALLPELELSGLAERCETGWRLAAGVPDRVISPGSGTGTGENRPRTG
ncbi:MULTISPECIES: DNA-processing protein DprA [Prauserella salsuginis group]|uniref:DNA-processing protein DprA n=1 Tax=Prauserella salsuginis TaxID=387889 RepID=A0ABW6G693_9PSEU|nr:MULTISPECIES: DNA-processing protein DprA [Prauserella salsuginis group]MCR3719315.1 DNA processing protein [Prauserella flava]MCR3735671.1 DNA processing protein [Prauserella salsuginis]